MKLKDIKLNKNNPRIIKDDKFNKLKKSISEFPKMLELRPMILDEDNTVLGGNMRLQALKALQYTEIPDNWIKYAKDLTDEEKQRFIFADNIGFGDWDWDIIANEWDSELLLDWGLDIPNIDKEDDLYTTKVESPIYTPKGDKPFIDDLCNLGTYEKLMNKIDNADINEREKVFLKLAATRHIVFDYSDIAEYYSHSDGLVQELMEESALVIIDYNKAIELGFVKVYNELSELMND